jgi:hypothetical protein
MRLPIIKNLVEFIEQNDEDFVLEAIEVLESVSQAKGLKDEELNTIGELLSNMYGAVEVDKEIKKGSSQKRRFKRFYETSHGLN